MDPFKPMEPLEPQDAQPTVEEQQEAPQQEVPQQEVPQQEVPQQPPVTGYYHGVGAGQRETLYPPQAYGYVPYQPAQPYVQQPYAQQPYYTYAPQPQPQPQPQPEPAPAPETPQEEKKPSAGKKVAKSMLLLIIAIALVVVSAGGAAVVTGIICKQSVQSQLDRQTMAWKEYLEDKLGVYEEQLGQLQDEIEDLQQQVNGTGGELTPPGEAMSAGDIYAQNVDSVVAITCMVVTTSNGQNYGATSAGTGFIISEDGYIVTNHHVIEGASSITVTMADGTEYTAKLIGSDATNDVALVKITATGLDPVTIGSSDQLRVGDQVVAIGNALGELSSSLTVGYVSGMDRDVTTDGSIINMIQTDAAINSGNSGGPLFNAKGEVIGITTAKYSGTTSSGASIEGISFAIPIDDVMELLQDLMEYGYVKTAYLGIYAADVDKAAADYYGFPAGVYVSSVEPDGCADEAGIRAKDIILELGGYEITCMNDLGRALRKLEAGETVSVVVWRSGQELVLTVTLDAKGG